jgi:hypothetical protein
MLHDILKIIYFKWLCLNMYVVFWCGGCGRYLYVGEEVGVRSYPSCDVLNKLGRVEGERVVENMRKSWRCY